jgi:glycine betaine/proline transport system substrate-binding protein
VIQPNLTGAKYTLAVPAYTFAAGLRTFADIARFAPQPQNSIYGIEPGNDGNRLVLSMLRQNLFGLGSFKLIESSEQGCSPKSSGRCAITPPSCSSPGILTR